MSLASFWVPEALAEMEAALPAISSRAAESCSVRPERARALPLEVRVRLRTSPTTPLMRWELPWSVPMASRMGRMTYFRIIRRAAHTRTIPAISVAALVTREVAYTRNSRPRASSAWAETEAESASKLCSAAALRAETSPFAMA